MNKACELWLARLEDEGVKLMVEVDLSLEQFRKLIVDGRGYDIPDEELYEYFGIVHRRLLPSDSGSFAGVGHDINVIVQEALRQPELPAQVDETQEIKP